MKSKKQKIIIGFTAVILLLVAILTVFFFYETEDQDSLKIFIHQYGAMDWNWFQSRMILFKGKYIHQRNQDGETLLMKAAYGHGSMKILETLTKKGADVNATDNEGMTPLMWAILGNERERATFLLKNGANVNAQDKKGNSPLLIALHSRNIWIVKLLLENGADVNHRNNESEMPLLKSLELGDFLSPPEEAGEIACLLIEHGADVNVKNSFGTTPLMMAVRHSQKKATYLLIEKGADVNARDMRGDSVLNYSSFDMPEIYQMLKKAGAK